jgi:cytochrome c biogenesis protein CcmG, thiol:disulfide interchange protein DsbE
LNKFLIPLGAFVLLAIVLAVGIKHLPEKGIIASPLLGKPAPAFTTTLLNDTGKTFDSAEFKGRWTLFNVWGTWCFECRNEHQALLDIAKRGEVRLIGLDWKDEDATATDWIKQLGNPFDVIATDHEGRIAIDWGVYAAPESFLVNPEGVVVYKFIGALTMEAWQSEFVPRINTKS